MSAINMLAKDFSSISGLPFLTHDNVVSFELGKKASLVLEMQSENEFYVSVCFLCDEVRNKKKLLKDVLKKLHPLKSNIFFCKAMLLNQYLVLSITESIPDMTARKLYLFKDYAVKTLVNSGVQHI